jgi:hypothetical protein
MKARTTARLVVPLAACVALVTASPAHPAGINLFWSDCSPGPTATTNRNFACHTNAGTHTLTASYDPPAGLSLVTGNDLILDLQSTWVPLTPWWEFENAGSCRPVSLSANPVFPTGVCMDPWSGQAIAGIAAYMNVGSDHRRIAASVAVSATVAGPQQAGNEYYSLNIVINSAKTVGDGACAGCLDPVCIVLSQLRIRQPAGTPGESPTLVNPLVSQYVTWQHGGVQPPGCPDVPAMNRTWGQLKGIYR